MEAKRPYKLTPADIRAIESVLNKDDRAEVVPIKDGAVRILHIRRETVKPKN